MKLVLSLFPGIGLLDMAFEQEGSCVVRGPDPLWGGDIRAFYPPAGVFAGIIGGPPCQSFSSLVHLIRANGHEPTFGNLIPEFERCVKEARPQWFLMENVPAAPDAVVEDYGISSFLLDNSALCDGTGHGQEQRRLRKFNFGRLGRSPISLLRWVDLATFSLEEAGTVTQWAPDNSPEAKRKSNAVFGDGRPTRKEARAKQHEALTGGHGVPPSVRDKRKTSSTVTGSGGGPSVRMGRYKLADALRLQGLPEDYLDHAPFTAEGKLKAVANGVPLFMGRALARAIKEAIKWE